MQPLIDPAQLTGIMDIGVQGLFYLITVIFVCFSLSIAYHWLAYGIHRSQSVLVLVSYMMVSTLFFIGMSISLNML